VYYSDLRVISKFAVRIAGAAPEVIASAPAGADTCTFTSIVRSIDEASPDPGIIATQRRIATPDGVNESIELRSRLGYPLEVEIVVSVTPDCAPLDRIKLGMNAIEQAPAVQLSGTTASWADNAVHASVDAPGAQVGLRGETIELRWMVSVPLNGGASVAWVMTARDNQAVVAGDRRRTTRAMGDLRPERPRRAANDHNKRPVTRLRRSRSTLVLDAIWA
jgi:hypothetical protein